MQPMKSLILRKQGGGPPFKKNKIEGDALKGQMLEIVNTKTIYGLTSVYDDDHTYSLDPEKPDVLTEVLLDTTNKVNRENEEPYR